MRRRRRSLADEGHRRNRQARHRSALLGRRRDLHARRIPLRDPGQAHPRTVVPEQRRQHQADRPAHRQGRRSSPSKAARAASSNTSTRPRPSLHPTVFQATGERHVGPGHQHLGGRVDAVERRLQRAGAVLHQQHPAARRRHPPDRPARGDDARDQQVHRRARLRQEGEGRNHAATTCAKA